MGIVTIKLQVTPMTEAEAASLKTSIQTAVSGKTVNVLEVNYSTAI